ncbi:PqqD family protein [Paenibacillus sp. IB182496]|uniref:PqqD family protein n=1 Tax=Paenibacillus sabuli TaxID=2772509 RepID=A0A927GUG2_9BACL|nr:PqqD family protein [Paenibacillus sabuli]MBD2848643.1 PqqD family protein [Paenibacillus sabuli]
MGAYTWHEGLEEAVELDDEWLVFHPGRFTVTKLNESGGVCWDLLRQPQTPDHLAEELVRLYAIDERDAQADVSLFLSHMLELGLIRHAG